MIYVRRLGSEHGRFDSVSTHRGASAQGGEPAVGIIGVTIKEIKSGFCYESTGHAVNSIETREGTHNEREYFQDGEHYMSFRLTESGHRRVSTHFKQTNGKDRKLIHGENDMVIGTELGSIPRQSATREFLTSCYEDGLKYRIHRRSELLTGKHAVIDSAIHFASRMVYRF